MVNKSILRSAIVEVLDEHDLDDGSLADDLLDRIVAVAPDEVYDDVEEDVRDSDDAD